MFKEFVLKNGLRVISVPLPHFYSTTLVFYVQAGSRFESKSQKGAAHFWEHLSLRGTRNFRSKLEIARFLDKLGARSNASTGRELVEYYIKMGNVNRNFPLALNFLTELVFEAEPQPKFLEIERQIIKNEFNEIYNDPKRLIFNTINKLTWSVTRFGEEVIGNLENLDSLKLEDLKEFHQEFFQPSRMVLGIAGSFSESILKGLTQKLEVYANSEIKSQRVNRPPQSFGHLWWIQRTGDRQSRFIFYFKGWSLKNPNRYAAFLLTVILGRGFGSRLFQSVREKLGLAYDIGCFLSSYSDTGILGIQGGVEEDSLVKTIKVISDEISKIKTKGITSEEMLLAKSKIKGHTALGLETPGHLLDWHAPQSLLKGKIETFEEYCRKIDAVKITDLQEIAQEVFKEGQFNFVFTSKKDYSNSLCSLLGIKGAP